MLCARVVRGMSSTESAVTPSLRHLLHDFRGTEWAQKSDNHLSSAHQGKVGLAGSIIRSVAEDLCDDVGGAKDRSTIGDDLCSLVNISRVRIASLLACSALDDDFESGLRQIGNDDGNERDPPLSGIALFGNSNDHATGFLSGIDRRGKQKTVTD